jgi:hypothetical protein
MSTVISIPEITKEDVRKPRYTHDCERCVFVGQDDEYDLYFHPSEFDPWVIARFQDGENGTIDCSAKKLINPMFRKAAKNAIALGIIKEEDLELNENDVLFFYEEKNSRLTQYIKDRKGRRCGVIEGFKITPDYYNIYAVENDESKKISEPFVIIVHSKVRPNCGDKFQSYIGQNLNIEKVTFVIDVMAGNVNRRIKYKNQKPVGDTLKLYEFMKNRVIRYFKTDKIYMYHDFFDYTKVDDTEEKLRSVINSVRKENINMDQLNLLLEGLAENVSV